jgi:hypothetical protein
MKMNEQNQSSLRVSILHALSDIIVKNKENSTVKTVCTNVFLTELVDGITQQVKELTKIGLGTDDFTVHDIEVEHGTVSERVFAFIVKVIAQIGPTAKTIIGPNMNQLNAVVFELPVQIFYELKKQKCGCEVKIVTPSLGGGSTVGNDR